MPDCIYENNPSETLEFIESNFVTSHELTGVRKGFLLDDGLFISVETLDDSPYHDYCEGEHQDIVDALEDFGDESFLERRNAIRFIEGYVIDLSSCKSISEKQLDAIAMILDRGDCGKQEYALVSTSDNQCVEYDRGEHISDDIVKRIKAYYASGTLSESMAIDEYWDKIDANGNYPVIVTDDITRVKNAIKRGDNPYRIYIHDDAYVVMNALGNLTHTEMVQKAVDRGLLDRDDFTFWYGEVELYKDENFLVTIPLDDTISKRLKYPVTLGEDGYYDANVYDFGVVYARDNQAFSSDLVLDLGRPERQVFMNLDEDIYEITFRNGHSIDVPLDRFRTADDCLFYDFDMNESLGVAQDSKTGELVDADERFILDAIDRMSDDDDAFYIDNDAIYNNSDVIMIARDGTIIDVSGNGWDTHNEFLEALFDNYIELFSGAYPYTYITEELGWMTLNTGGGWGDDRCKVVYDGKVAPTQVQWDLLEEWLDKQCCDVNSDVVVYFMGEQRDYNMIDYGPKDIIKSMKKCTTSGLLESKQDIQRFYDWAGKELADRFFRLKPRLKGRDRDIYFWMDKNLDKEFLKNTLDALENIPTRKEIDDKGKAGAEKVYEDNAWRVYRINNFEASVKYGKNTQWCITGMNTGNNDVDDNGHDLRDLPSGKEYWDAYAKSSIIYFYIPKHPTRSSDEKYALVTDKKNSHWTLYDSGDWVEVANWIENYKKDDAWNPYDGTRPQPFPMIKGLPDINAEYDRCERDWGYERKGEE